MENENKIKPPELMHWESEYSVGVKEIDAQHLELMKKINDLISHSINSLDEGVRYFEETMNAVIEDTAIHFKTEEKLLLKTDYEVFADHKKEHDELMGKVESIKKELKKIKAETDLRNLTISFREWFLSHILLYDKEARDSFKAASGEGN